LDWFNTTVIRVEYPWQLIVSAEFFQSNPIIRNAHVQPAFPETWLESPVRTCVIPIFFSKLIPSTGSPDCA
jgi:hypothetical protein